MIKKIENFLNKWRIEEDKYQRYIYNQEKGIEYEFDTELYNLLKNEKNIQYELVYVGGFESPGYEIDCCCLAIVVEGKLYTYSINFENF